jgi:hypothetical protein
MMYSASARETNNKCVTILAAVVFRIGVGAANLTPAPLRATGLGIETACPDSIAHQKYLTNWFFG